MITRLQRTFFTALLILSVTGVSQAESDFLSKLTLAGHFGVFIIDGTGEAQPSAWDTVSDPIPIDSRRYATTSLVRQEPAKRLGFGWDSNSSAIFGLSLGYRVNEHFHFRFDTEWTNKEETANDYGYYVSPDIPGYSGEVYEYLDKSSWTQGTVGLFVEYAPFAKFPNLYAIGGVQYSQFKLEFEFYRQQWTESSYSSEKLEYDDIGSLFGYTLGTGLLFARKPGHREGFIELTWTFMRYGTAASFSEDATLFGRKVEVELGGVRITTGYRFHIAQIWQSAG